MNNSTKTLTTWAKEHSWQIAFLFVGILLPLALLGKIADEIHEGGSFSWDNTILYWIHLHATPHRDSLVAWLTRTGGVLAVPLFIAVIFAFRFLKHQGNALFFAVNVIGALFLNWLAKLFFHRVRPDLWISPAPETSYSFPSGHSMVSMSIAAAFIALSWKTRWRWPVFGLALASTFVIGFSRMYLGVHYPSDVLGGWSAGLIWTCGLYWILQRGHRKPIPA